MAKAISKEVEKEEVVTEPTPVDTNAQILAMLEKMQNRLDEMEKKNAVLEKRNAELEKNIAKEQEEPVHQCPIAAPAYEETRAYRPEPSSLTDMVTIYCNFFGTIDVSLPDLALTMETFGESRDITYQQFQQLVGKYRKFFDREWILIDSRHIDLIEKFKVHGYDPYSKTLLHSKDVDKIARMNNEELRCFYEELNPNSKNAFLSLWLNKCYERNPDFYDFGKMNVLNVASKSSTFDSLIREYSNAIQKSASGSVSADQPIRV